MQWTELREQCPNRFVLVEAVVAYSKDGQRVIEEMALVEQYQNVSDAWNGYKKIRRAFPEKQLYIFHTSKEKIEVEEQYFTGVRGRS